MRLLAEGIARAFCLTSHALAASLAKYADTPSVVVHTRRGVRTVGQKLL
jgi:hypothetical protein